jgi:hypothetical protein
MKAPFRQVDVFRAVRGAQRAGINVNRVEIDANGKIVVSNAEAPQVSEGRRALQQWRAEQEWKAEQEQRRQEWQEAAERDARNRFREEVERKRLLKISLKNKSATQQNQ